MIWDKLDCPFCGATLEPANSSMGEPIYFLQCPTMVKLPEALSIKSRYHNEQLKSHFDIEYQNHRPFYQVIRVWPFAIQSYDGITNISKYDADLIPRFIVEVPMFNIPWNDRDRLIQKLTTYVLLS